MITYKGYYIWHNSLRGNKPWLLQSGVEIIGQYKTISAAKRMATILSHDEVTALGRRMAVIFNRIQQKSERRATLIPVY